MDLKLTYLVLLLGIGLVIAADGPAGVNNTPKPGTKVTDSDPTKHSSGSDTPDSKKVTAVSKPQSSEAKGPTTASGNTTADDNGLKGAGMYQKFMENKGMLMRTFLVLICVTSIVVLYFVIRAWRTKRRHSKSRKYGLITSSGADLEMEPLDQNDDDDDEMTMFERRK